LKHRVCREAFGRGSPDTLGLLPGGSFMSGESCTRLDPSVVAVVRYWQVLASEYRCNKAETPFKAVGDTKPFSWGALDNPEAIPRRY